MAILPYYIANLNIEYTYRERTGHYREFPGLCFVDTLDNLAWKGATGGAVVRWCTFSHSQPGCPGFFAGCNSWAYRLFSMVAEACIELVYLAPTVLSKLEYAYVEMGSGPNGIFPI